jgi:hypothetical protein
MDLLNLSESLILLGMNAIFVAQWGTPDFGQKSA